VYVYAKVMMSCCLVEPVDKMMEECINAVRNVLTRQYQRYFNINVNDQLQKETESVYITLMQSK